MGRLLNVRACLVTGTARSAGNMANHWHVDGDDQQAFLRRVRCAGLLCVSSCFISRLSRVVFFLPVDPRTTFASCLRFLSESMSTWRSKMENLTGNGPRLSALSIIKETNPIGPVHYPWARRQEMRRPVFNAASLAALSAAWEQSREHPSVQRG